MKVVNIKKVKKKLLGSPLFTGKATSQTPITDEEGVDVSVNYINFSKGVHNKFHKHSNDQILIVTQGVGIVATGDKKVRVKKGDVVWSPAGEAHWHGAASKSKFAHISITKAQTKLTQVVFSV